MTTYLVCSKEYGTVIPIMDYGEGPTEYGRDCIYVKLCSPSKHRARVLALRAFRRQKAKFLDYDDENPFTDMRVYHEEGA